MKRPFPNLLPALGWLAVVALLTFPVFTLSGAVDMFLKLDGHQRRIPGQAPIKDEIDVLAWSWGASNSGTTHLGGGSGAGKANVQDISVTKYIDKSSPTLLLNTMNGKHIPTALLTIRKAGDEAVGISQTRAEGHPRHQRLHRRKRRRGPAHREHLAELRQIQAHLHAPEFGRIRRHARSSMQWNIVENNDSF